MGSSHLYVLEKSRKESFVDEKRLGKKAESLREEKEKSEQLLANILPEFVIKMMNREWIMKRSSQPISKDFPDCSILYCDIVDFTSLASTMDPLALVKLLNQVFSEFDRVVEENGCEKIKTDGDAYVCAAGLTIQLEEHYKAMVNCAVQILNLKVLKTNCQDKEIRIRVGVATGSVIGGVIGVQKFQFDVWGEAIALAHSLEQTGVPGRIQIAEYGLEKLPFDSFNIIENTEKPLGIQTYFILPNPIDTTTTTNNNPLQSPNTIITENNDIIKDNIMLDGCDQKIKVLNESSIVPRILINDLSSSDIQQITPPIIITPVPNTNENDTIINNVDDCSSNINNNNNNNENENERVIIESLVSTTTPPPCTLKKSKGKVQFKDIQEKSEIGSTDTFDEFDDEFKTNSSNNSFSDQSINSTKDELSIDMKPLKGKRKVFNYMWNLLKSKLNYKNPMKPSNNIEGDHKKKNRVETILTDMDRDFKKYTAMNKYIVQFRKFFVEKEFHKYVIRNTLIETKFFLVIGLILHLVFFVDDLVMKSQSIYGATYIYIAMACVFVVFFVLSFTQLFRKPIIYQIAFTSLLLLFGISTILELLRYGNPLARSSLTRVCATLFYVNVFHSLNFICIVFINLFIFGFLFISAGFLSPSMIDHIFTTDYIGIIIVLIIQLFSSYMMKKAMRNAWVIKSKVKFKGLVLNKEREKSSKLLENILPNSISQQLMSEGKGNGMEIAQSYNQVAIMFINIVGFEKLPDSQEASTMINNMNTIFSTFDGLLAGYNDLEKIKTIGTTYMVVGGLKRTTPKIYLFNMADMALTAKALVKHHSKEQLNVQIGISIGPCVAGCIGIQRAKFDIWGDTANISSRMQTSSPNGKIQVTKEVSRILRKKFFLEDRGTIRIKGKGDMNTFFLTAKKGSTSELDSNGNSLPQLNGYEWPSTDIQKLLQFSGSYNIKEDEILK